MGLFDPLPPQDAFYGISRKNIAPRLTRNNWQSKAVVRIHQNGWLYIWIRKTTYTNEAGKDVAEYHVRLHGATETAGSYEQGSPALSRALNYANGDDEGRLAKDTTSARPEQYPDDQEPSAIINATANDNAV